MPRPLLPRLATPLTPDTVRPQLRRLIVAQKRESGGPASLIQFLAARGYAAHPADWMPDKGDEWANAVYARWIAWREEGAGSASAGQPAFGMESYDDTPWAERRVALAALRRRDPAGARAIISAKAGSEPAERRLALVEIYADRLEPDDAAVLEEFTKDRSERVATLARRLLARLGRASGDPDLAAELAAQLTVARRGLLRRRAVLTVPPLKTPAQEARRDELFGLVAFADLAAALRIPPTELLAGAPEGGMRQLRPLVENVAATASEEARRVLIASLLEDGEAPLALITPLVARADPEERRRVVALAAPLEINPAFTDLLALAGPALGAASYASLAGSKAWAALLDQIAQPPAAVGLFNVAMLLDQGGACATLKAAVDAGLSSADPRLDALRLNCALPHAAPEEHLQDD
jgi:hypothetical protein